MAITAPYGTWESPVTAEMIVARTIGLHSLQADGDALYWLEYRPAEAGRTLIVRRGGDGAVTDMTPPPFDIGSRVHEYGGGAYIAAQGKVVFSHKADGTVWLIADGAAPRPVAAVPGCRYADFHMHPDGRRVVCVREDHRAAGEAAAAIVSLELDPSDAACQEGAVLVSGPDFLAAPRLSPDGAQLAWISWNHPDMPWDSTQLWLAPLQGAAVGAARAVAGADRREALVQPAWSPGGVLHVCSDRDEWWNLYRLSAEGLRPVCPMPAEIGGPHWVFGQRAYVFETETSILALRITQGVVDVVRIRNGMAAAAEFGPIAEAPVVLRNGTASITALPDALPAIVLARPGAAPAVLRAAGDPVLDRADIAVAQAITFPTDDGGTGHAFWYAPRNARYQAPPAEKPPLIVISHGGPTGMSSPAFTPKVQWWTSRGFGVLDVNYGGSTGFGRAYRQRLDGQWGVVDVADCLAAARHVAAQGLVDPARMAIRGGSAGGFTTLAALCAGDVFRAGASHYGVADLMLLAGDTHKFESRYLDRLVGPLPGAEAVYRARSPIHQVERLNCPVIFFQGLDDKVVPPNQARAMASAMAARGLRAPLHEFAGEAHGFRRAETISRVLELETAFYAEVFGLHTTSAGSSVQG